MANYCPKCNRVYNELSKYCSKCAVALVKAPNKCSANSPTTYAAAKLNHKQGE